MVINRKDVQLLLNDYILPLYPVLSESFIVDYLTDDESGKQEMILVDDATKARLTRNRKNYVSLTDYTLNGENGLLFYFRQHTLPPIFSFMKCSDTSSDSIRYISKLLYGIVNSIFAFRRKESSLPPHEKTCYIRALSSTAVLVAITQTLSGENNNIAHTTMLKVIYELEDWATKTYEGTKIPFGFIIDINDSSGGEEDYTEFLKTKHSALLTDGMFSAIMLDKHGRIISYIPLISSGGSPGSGNDRLPLCPSRFSEFARRCSGQKIGIIALSNGDIMIYQNEMLAFTRRSGTWGRWNLSYLKFSFDKVFPAGAIDEFLLKQVYISLMNVSFSHCGSCFAVVDPGERNKVDELIGKGCVLVPEPGVDYKSDAIKQKNTIIKELIRRRDENSDDGLLSFQEINEKLRTEVMGLDGAFVIDTTGNVIAVGSILSVSPGSDEGGRSAAAKALSRHGIGIKVSEDGDITIFRSGEQVLKLFNDPTGLG